MIRVAESDDLAGQRVDASLPGLETFEEAVRDEPDQSIVEGAAGVLLGLQQQPRLVDEPVGLCVAGMLHQPSNCAVRIEHGLRLRRRVTDERSAELGQVARVEAQENSCALDGDVVDAPGEVQRDQATISSYQAQIVIEAQFAVPRLEQVGVRGDEGAGERLERLQRDLPIGER